MKTKTIIVLFVAVGLLLLVAGCTETTPVSVTPEQTLTPLVKSTVKTTIKTTVNPTVKTTVATKDQWIWSNIEEIADNSNPYISTYTITGTLTNNGDYEKKFIVVKAEYYDANDVKLGFSSTVIDSLKPGESGRFKIISMDKSVVEEIDRYTVSAP